MTRGNTLRAGGADLARFPVTPHSVPVPRSSSMRFPDLSGHLPAARACPPPAAGPLRHICGDPGRGGPGPAAGRPPLRRCWCDGAAPSLECEAGSCGACSRPIACSSRTGPDSSSAAAEHCSTACSWPVLDTWMMDLLLLVFAIVPGTASRSPSTKRPGHPRIRSVGDQQARPGRAHHLRHFEPAGCCPLCRVRGVWCRPWLLPALDGHCAHRCPGQQPDTSRLLITRRGVVVADRR